MQISTLWKVEKSWKTSSWSTSSFFRDISGSFPNDYLKVHNFLSRSKLAAESANTKFLEAMLLIADTREAWEMVNSRIGNYWEIISVLFLWSICLLLILSVSYFVRNKRLVSRFDFFFINNLIYFEIHDNFNQNNSIIIIWSSCCENRFVSFLHLKLIK